MRHAALFLLSKRWTGCESLADHPHIIVYGRSPRGDTAVPLVVNGDQAEVLLPSSVSRSRWSPVGSSVRGLGGAMVKKKTQILNLHGGNLRSRSEEASLVQFLHRFSFFAVHSLL